MAERDVTALLLRPRTPRDLPPEGFHYVIAPDEGWEVVTDDRHMKCRQPKCPNEGVAILWRPVYGRFPKRPWRYCADHLYGRWIENGEVVHWRLVKDDPDA